ncbi:MAG: hypothetical protein ACFB50_17445 [Rubrobacteraceae bacterium]
MERDGPHQFKEYEPGILFKALYWIITVAIVLAGISFSLSNEYREFSSSLGWFWSGATLIAALVGPPAIQYALLRSFGSRPSRTKWMERSDSYLILFWKSGSCKFTPNQFALVCGVPALFQWALLIPYAAANPISAGAIGFALAIFVGNFLYSLMLFRSSQAALVERTDRGLRLYNLSSQI